MRQTTCALCGHDLTAPGSTTRFSLGRRYDAHHGWHNATAKGCTWCHALVRWEAPFYQCRREGHGAPQHELELLEYAQLHGSHFFDPDTMRFFGSRLAPGVSVAPDKSRVYFITSERDPLHDKYPAAWGGQRRYTLRAMFPGAEFKSVDEFGEFDTLRQARSALAQILAAVVTA